MYNITTMTSKAVEFFIKPMDWVSNGSDTGRFLGTTKRGVYVVAWGDKRNDFETIEKLSEYLARHQ